MKMQSKFSVEFNVKVPVCNSGAHTPAQQTSKTAVISLVLSPDQFSCHFSDEEVVNILESMFTLDKRVPDIIWNKVSSPCDKTDKIYKLTQDNKNLPQEELERIKNNGSIVVILESPHRDEYCMEGFIPRFPARGSAGDAIGNNLCRVIKQANTILSKKRMTMVSKTLPLIICNPIQYQTSLNWLFHRGSSEGINRAIRDKVWRKLFRIEELQNDFIRRICDYRPRLIINACTYQFKSRIENVMRKRGITCPIVQIQHPSAAGGWNSVQGMRMGKIVLGSPNSY